MDGVLRDLEAVVAGHDVTRAGTYRVHLALEGVRGVARAIQLDLAAEAVGGRVVGKSNHPRAPTEKDSVSNGSVFLLKDYLISPEVGLLEEPDADVDAVELGDDHVPHEGRPDLMTIFYVTRILNKFSAPQLTICMSCLMSHFCVLVRRRSAVNTTFSWFILGIHNIQNLSLEPVFECISHKNYFLHFLAFFEEKNIICNFSNFEHFFLFF